MEFDRLTSEVASGLDLSYRSKRVYEEQSCPVDKEAATDASMALPLGL